MVKMNDEVYAELLKVYRESKGMKEVTLADLEVKEVTTVAAITDNVDLAIQKNSIIEDEEIEDDEFKD